MTKTNVQICSNCGEENPLYEKNCCKCRHYLRTAVINIDLWKTIWQLFESPAKALTNIVYAEYKNFLIFLLIFLSVKIYLISVIIQSAFNIYIPESRYFLYNFFLLVGIYLFIVVIYSFLFTKVVSFRQKIRFKDTISLIVYSFVPIILPFFLLFPVEYGIFGKHWFIYNPSPFLIKGTLAYIFVVLEIIMLGWSLLILSKAFYLQSSSKILTVVSMSIFLIIIGCSIRFIPYIIL